MHEVGKRDQAQKDMVLRQLCAQSGLKLRDCYNPGLVTWVEQSKFWGQELHIWASLANWYPEVPSGVGALGSFSVAVCPLLSSQMRCSTFLALWQCQWWGGKKVCCCGALGCWVCHDEAKGSFFFLLVMPQPDTNTSVWFSSSVMV